MKALYSAQCFAESYRVALVGGDDIGKSRFEELRALQSRFASDVRSFLLLLAKESGRQHLRALLLELDFTDFYRAAEVSPTRTT